MGRLFLAMARTALRDQNTPEKTTHLQTQNENRSELRFRVCFVALLEENKEHPKTQHTRKRSSSERSPDLPFLGVLFFLGLF